MAFKPVPMLLRALILGSTGSGKIVTIVKFYCPTATKRDIHMAGLRRAGQGNASRQPDPDFNDLAGCTPYFPDAFIDVLLILTLRYWKPLVLEPRQQIVVARQNLNIFEKSGFLYQGELVELLSCLRC
uniref:Uncharacterized protein n=1 Tax=Coccidioides posadasii RMSCC 3488 TaxID=454284 RepID=A0A0J6FQD7_COCPO|nr:hypothetical protein CPAG_07516 [Coccidioides posadasii RMSCC 3488]